MTNETCPHCGAGDPRFYDLGTQYSCLSFDMKDGSEARTDRCRAKESDRAYDMLLGAFPEECSSVSLPSCVAVLLRKLAAVTTELADMQQRIGAAPVAWVKLPDGDFDAEIHLSREEAVDVWGNPEENNVTRVRLVAEPEPAQEQ